MSGESVRQRARDEMTNDQKLSEIRDRESKATKGPWFWRKCYEMGSGARHWALKSPESEAANRVIGVKGTLSFDSCTPPGKWHADPDNQFIAHARADIPYLLSALDSERERVLLEAAKRLCHFCQSGDGSVLIPQSGAWLHSDSFQENSENGSWPFRCKAYLIHDLRSKGVSQNEKLSEVTELTNEQAREMLRKYSAALQAYAVADAGSEAERIADAESDRLEDEIVRVLAESSLARKQEREANCAAICIHCKDSSHSEEYTGKAELRDGKWVHQEIGYDRKCVFDCDAASIHERGREEQG